LINPKFCKKDFACNDKKVVDKNSNTARITKLAQKKKGRVRKAKS